MTYGKTQRALLTFLEKYPDRWHRIKGRKAIEAARRLRNYMIGVSYTSLNSHAYVRYDPPQMLRRQA